ncbi:Hypothetical protein HDN1F_23660 [gamma proteobacterium HdN1]|nr:Hypothetical protein HDN1F_23660 [gamma proteobacterium HdN1]
MHMKKLFLTPVMITFISVLFLWSKSSSASENEENRGLATGVWVEAELGLDINQYISRFLYVDPEGRQYARFIYKENKHQVTDKLIRFDNKEVVAVETYDRKQGSGESKKIVDGFIREKKARKVTKLRPKTVVPIGGVYEIGNHYWKVNSLANCSTPFEPMVSLYDSHRDKVKEYTIIYYNQKKEVSYIGQPDCEFMAGKSMVGVKLKAMIISEVWRNDVNEYFIGFENMPLVIKVKEDLSSLYFQHESSKIIRFDTLTIKLAEKNAISKFYELQKNSSTEIEESGGTIKSPMNFIVNEVAQTLGEKKL